MSATATIKTGTKHRAEGAHAIPSSDLLPVPNRPLLRYHGGKWKMADRIISYFPQHRIYVEPYGGAGSVLLQKPRCYAEIYNDLDGEIVNLFRMVRERGNELAEKLKATPFSRVEYRLSFEVSEDPMEQARRTVIRSFMGFGSNSLCRNIQSGFRSNSNRSGTTAAHDWQNYPHELHAIIKRLGGVVIENRDALEVMLRHDTEECLHYCDPPYVHETRSAAMHGAHGYSHEMTDDDHRKMAAVLNELKGMVIVSGYACSLYDDELFADWRRVEWNALADGARERTEVLWLRNVESHGMLPGLDG
jgi:DNA adenine methylase